MRRLESQDGISFVEVIVVMIVIGVLAAIALPAFASQRSKSHDAEAKQAVRSAITAIETYYQEANNYALTAADVQSREPALATASALDVRAVGRTYRVSLRSGSGSTFGFERTVAGERRFCTPVGRGGCSASGEW